MVVKIVILLCVSWVEFAAETGAAAAITCGTVTIKGKKVNLIAKVKKVCGNASS